MKHTLFDLTYGKTAMLPINFTVETYPVQPINEKNFQETLQRRAYTLLSTLEKKRKIAAIHIEQSQAYQKERHNNKLPPITNEFKVGNKVLLHRTKAKKQWNEKFENKWDRPFYIHEILGNGSYKLRLDDKILAKKETTAPVANHSQNYHPYRRKTRSHFENRLPRLLKQALEENLLIAPIDIPLNTTIHTLIYKYFHIEKTLYEQKLELETTNFTSEAIQKQIHNEFKTAAGPTNTHYKLRAAFRLYDLFNTCENVLQNPILQPMKVQYIGKLTELKFQQFSDQITSIILDHYLNITDSVWTLTELNFEEKIMLPVEF
ncbi:hypothetical protein G9A89_014137 [Geosiphon pyriformis]|nr:hypothetical protein G9A89_014137 [Geosiphon pyriformis]